MSIQPLVLAFTLCPACPYVNLCLFPDLDVCSCGRVSLQPCVRVALVSCALVLIAEWFETTLVETV